MKAFQTALIALALSAAGPLPAFADGSTVGHLRIIHLWAKPSLKGVPNGAAYMAISNNSDTEEVLLSVSSPVAKAAELHTMEITGGVMRMRQIEGGVKLPPGDTVVMEPGGKHVMLIGLKQRLEVGSRFDLTLTFKNAGELRIEGAVRERAPDAQNDAS